MCVTVEDCRGPKSVDRFFETTRTEEGIDFRMTARAALTYDASVERKRRAAVTKREPETDARTRLITAAGRGGMTLVLGAGVSIEAGVPNWQGLAVRIWRRAFKTPGDGSPVD